MARSQRSLFEQPLPSGFHYRSGFVAPGEERSLADAIAGIEFATFEMRGVVARRRVAFFGTSYEATAVAPPIPEFLEPFRERIAAWAAIDVAAFVMALINEYPAGAPIGWHRDAPQYGIVGGMSLLSACRMKFRPYRPPDAPSEGGRRIATHEILLEPRSAYLLTGESRHAYEHHIPAVPALRYSITFRTLR